MINPFAKKVTSAGTTQREFVYSTKKVHLKFTLRTDVKQELRDFLSLLEVASKEVQEEINKK